MSHRLFIAIRPPEPVIDAMIDVMDGIENARWQDEAQLHLTLRYVGEVDTPTANDIADALGRIRFAPFDLTYRGVGHFERSHWPSAVWAGVVPSPGLDTLAKKVERACVSAGCAPETRRFTPHVTLARLNRSSGPVGDWMARHGDFACAPVRVDHFTLYESTLSHSGSHYDPVVRFSLA
ncbi:RNA 2',3'-cyclic phosphodiesterase [Croceicoccus naphthovorans]|uniref:RNA 2',3'-cyclic phosphodiesterase n=1 Tax=Croceicoccus naphthovorans TaxID=1348774 RepID=A0A0G3XH01_9SPHN|nr:RNA 2',3'-cyclic phosphodiesterase [Croceicoccus naphthovorans]AKM09628.1 2'-5' RNA ligase [Croceicoccus naphthovorans]MBB3989594.1 2'-5' RNA ligase [Croceicoccus naphthovorans]